MMHTIVINKLKELKGKKVYFEPLAGNNGDNLMRLGAMVLFKELGLDLVDDISKAETVVVSGNGDLTIHPKNKPIEKSLLGLALLKYKDLPVIVLPCSCIASNAKRLSDIFNLRTGSTTIIARDEISYSLFREFAPANVEVYVDHDMSFALIGSDWLNDVKKRISNNSLLVVERFDAERATKPPGVFRIPVLFRSLVPNSLKNLIKKRALGAVYGNTPFVTEAISKAREHFPSLNYNVVKTGDISLPQNYSFESFVAEIANASAVVSTRMHVCIMAALLGKPFIAVQFEGGHKVSALFEKSLQKLPNARLWIKRPV